MNDKLRIVVGADDAGFTYKQALKGDLLATRAGALVKMRGNSFRQA
jgi:hypothetical protein